MRNVFIELTNPVHGGIGWEFGSCLWSPERSKESANRKGADSWATMRKPKAGDIIVHSYNTSSTSHIIQGLSVVTEECYVTDVEPEIAGEWSGYERYYRIELSKYTNLINKKPLQDFLNMYHDDIRRYHGEEDITGTFYNTNIKVAQKYFEKVDLEIFDLLLEFLEISNVNDFFKIDSKNDDKTADSDKTKEVIPPKKDYIVSRRIRDTKIIQDLKKKYKNTCQICGKSIRTRKDKFYSEGAHIKPLGDPHNGSDTMNNVIILCPNHHVEFDYGIITINTENDLINHTDKNNRIHGQKLHYGRPDINKEYLKYHNTNIFKDK